MSGFQPGWYRVRFDVKTRQSWCRYFSSPSTYTAECRVEPNGQQFLLWWDAAGPQGTGRAAAWSADYERLDTAPRGDWWDNPRSDSRHAPETPGAFARHGRQPTPRELAQRAACLGTTDGGLSCSRQIHVSVFFDGTNNNMVRDRKDGSHSNIVTLYDLHENDKVETFAYYLPGVGTPFPEIGEFGESNDGKAYAAGGEARIHYAMLQVMNAVCRASTTRDLMQVEEMKQLVTSTFDGLATWWRLGDGKMQGIFEGLQRRLKQAIEGRRPRVTQVHLSIFGFSRGAAEARVFANWIQMVSQSGIAGAGLELRFLGLFDTVASVALADSSRIASGFLDWADGNLDITGVTRTVHYVAAHEIRQSFPLSTARTRSAYPQGVKEFVYPGAHSDLGGGYDPGSQGKAMNGRASLLSQIPLNDMYFEALNAGVKLRPLAKMAAGLRESLAVHPALDTAFNAYLNWTTLDEKQNVAQGGARCENRMQYHTHMYWRWRAQASPDARFKAMGNFTRAKPQDQTDLWESELDWRKDVEEAQRAHLPSERVVATRFGTRTITMPPTPTDLQRAIVSQIKHANTVSTEVSEFFSSYVHDSHAGFWLLGPQTEFDKKAYLKEILDKKAMYDGYMKRAESELNPGRRRNFENAARAYELNTFEKKVLAANPAGSTVRMPLMTDADAEDMRAMAGTATSAAMWWLGTASRREPKGHGRYREVFDES